MFYLVKGLTEIIYDETGDIEDYFIVIKKSENVCDLIERDDLVRFEGHIEEIETIDGNNVGTNYRCEYREDFDKAVTAIYKLRDGDYILAWKKES